MLERMEPRRETCTMRSMPTLSASSETISPVTLPKVALSSPPNLGGQKVGARRPSAAAQTPACARAESRPGRSEGWSIGYGTQTLCADSVGSDLRDIG